MSMQKDKARTHEKRIAKVLSDWAGSKFLRTPASGSLRWRSNDAWIWGDICPPDDLVILCECKHHHSLSIEGLLIQDNKICDWWGQLKDDQKRAEAALEMSVFPMLAFRRDHGRDFLMVESVALDWMPRLYPGTPSKRIRGLVLTDMGLIPQTSICDFQTFLDATPPSRIRQYLSQMACRAVQHQ